MCLIVVPLESFEATVTPTAHRAASERALWSAAVKVNRAVTPGLEVDLPVD